jgi:membrane peptidoglycan carboxypeptidase
MRAAPRLVLRVETLDGRVLWTSRPARTAVVDAGVAFLVTEALRDAVDRGSGSRVRRAGFRGVAAGKTGTTKPHREFFLAGWEPAAFCPGLGDPPAAGFWTDGRVSAPPRLGEEQLRAILARAEARRDQ